MDGARLQYATSMALPLTLAAGLLVATSATAQDPSPPPAIRADATSAGPLQEIRTIEDHRWLQHPSLLRHLKSSDPQVVEAALVAIGRIGDVGFTQPVVDALASPQPKVRAAAAFALGLLRGEPARTAILSSLTQERDPEVRAQLYLAAGRSGVEQTIAPLAAVALQEEEPEGQAAAAEGMAVMVRRLASTAALPPALLQQWIERSARSPADRAVASAFALSVLRGAINLPPEQALLSAFQRASAPSARTFLARVLQRNGSAPCVEALIRAVRSDPVLTIRAEAARQLGRVAWSAPIGDALKGALQDPNSQVVVAAAQALAAAGTAAAALADPLERLYVDGRSDWIKQEALSSLAAVDSTRARPHIQAAVQSPSWRLRTVAAAALVRFGTDADLSSFQPLLSDTDSRVTAVAVENLAAVDPARVSPAAKEAVRASVSRHDPAALWAAANAAITFGWKDLVPDLAAQYDAYPLPVNLGERETILWAIGSLGAKEYLPLVERGLSDSERTVVVAAADAYQALTGVSMADRIPLVSRVEGSTPSWREVTRALHSRVMLVTRHGPIVIRMRSEAPLTAANFVRLARQGFYDGKEFHRVVPNFVTQGGDPRADGWGGSDRLVREEISSLRHLRGTVGMATTGKDTATCQFYFNLGWNVHLDGNYTAFGEVVSGMERVDRIEIGDVIQRAVVLDD